MRLSGAIHVFFPKSLLLFLFRFTKFRGQLRSPAVRHRLCEPHPRRRLVDQIDRLVRQIPVIDVPHAHLHGGFQRLIRNSQMMVYLIARAEPFQNLNRLLLRRLLDNHLLKSPLKRRVLLNPPAVFFQCRRADQLNFSSRERRLHDIGRVQRALGASRADQRMNLVDEQEYVA